MQNRTSINPKTKVFALIGNPVSHSMSPAIHNGAFMELNIDSIYVAFQVEDVKNTFAEAIQKGATKLGEVTEKVVEGVGTLTFVYFHDPEGNIVEIQSWKT